MTKIFLTDDHKVLAFLQSARLPGGKLSGETLPDLAGREVVVIGAPGAARAAAAKLGERGLPAWQLSYVDWEPRSSLSDAIKHPKHLFWDDARSLNEAPDDPDFATYSSGFTALDPHLRWRLPELCIMAGPYGSGKSLLAQILAARFAAMYGDGMDCRALLCSWEDMASEMRWNVTRHAQALGYADPSELRDRVHYVCRPPSEDRLITWYMDLARYYHKRFNTKFFVLDPWNEIDHQKDVRQSETDYVRDMMKEFRRLVDELKIVLIIVTHVPAKTIRQDGSLEPFRLAQAFGSVQFANKADRGICVLRSKSLACSDHFIHNGDGTIKRLDHMVIRFDKSKIERKMGDRGTVAMCYNHDGFSLDPCEQTTLQVKDLWKN
jgi:hypothetical protein